MRFLRWLPSVLLLLPWLLSPTAPANDTRVRDLASPNAFRLLDWETVHIAADAGALWSGLSGVAPVSSTDADTLRTYFASKPHAVDARPSAETAIEHLVAQAYRDGGLTQVQRVPVPGLFPPVLLALSAPPDVLVIAPRSELRVIQSTVLEPTSVTAREQLERSADSTGVSSLVVPIGGLATYPSMVLDTDTAQQVLSAAAHEWMHQYLIFYPLGAGYWNSQETREINETTADMVGNEVGAQIAASHDLTTPPANAAPPASTGFDFTAFMRATRAQTEQLLAAGQVDAAEAYMNARRDELQQHGYSIRKLNQAYFALYGSYGESYAASPTNPIPGLLRTLRGRSSSLGDFVAQVRSVTTVAQLRQLAA